MLKILLKKYQKTLKNIKKILKPFNLLCFFIFFVISYYMDLLIFGLISIPSFFLVQNISESSVKDNGYFTPSEQIIQSEAYRDAFQNCNEFYCDDDVPSNQRSFFYYNEHHYYVNSEGDIRYLTNEEKNQGNIERIMARNYKDGQYIVD